MTLTSKSLLATALFLLAPACTANVDDPGGSTSGSLSGGTDGAGGPTAGAAKHGPRIALARLLPLPPKGATIDESAPKPPLRLVPFALPEPPKPGAEPQETEKPHCVVFRPEPPPEEASCDAPPGDAPPPEGEMPAEGAKPIEGAKPTDGAIAFDRPEGLGFSWGPAPEGAPPALAILHLAVFDTKPAAPDPEAGEEPKPILPDVVVECVAPPGASHVSIPKEIVDDLLAKHGEDAVAELAIAHFPLPPKEGAPPPEGADGAPMPPPEGADGAPMPPPEGADGAPPPEGADGAPMPPPDACRPPVLGRGAMVTIPLHAPDAP